jgi:hypothetical protein
MKIYRRLERDGSGRTWKPTEPGDMLEGEFQGIEDGQFGKLIVVEELERGRRLIPVWATLQDQVKQLESGHLYRFTLEKFITVKNGKEIRDIVVDEVTEDGAGPEADAGTEADPAAEDVPF